MRRHVLTEHYRALINAIYGNKTTVPIQAHVTYRDGREGTVKTFLNIKSVTKGVSSAAASEEVSKENARYKNCAKVEIRQKNNETTCYKSVKKIT